MILNKGRG